MGGPARSDVTTIELLADDSNGQIDYRIEREDVQRLQRLPPLYTRRQLWE
jgi:hypothetical protein